MSEGRGRGVRGKEERKEEGESKGKGEDTFRLQCCIILGTYAVHCQLLL